MFIKDTDNHLHHWLLSRSLVLKRYQHFAD